MIVCVFDKAKNFDYEIIGVFNSIVRLLIRKLTQLMK